MKLLNLKSRKPSKLRMYKVALPRRLPNCRSGLLGRNGASPLRISLVRLRFDFFFFSLFFSPFAFRQGPIYLHVVPWVNCMGGFAAMAVPVRGRAMLVNRYLYKPPIPSCFRSSNTFTSKYTKYISTYLLYLLFEIDSHCIPYICRPDLPSNFNHTTSVSTQFIQNDVHQDSRPCCPLLNHCLRPPPGHDGPPRGYGPS